MRIPPLLTDFIHDRVCKPNCEKMLTLPKECTSHTKQQRLFRSHTFPGQIFGAKKRGAGNGPRVSFICSLNALKFSRSLRSHIGYNG